MKVSKRFFYFLIIVSLIVALFYSILLGLIVLILDIGYFFYINNKAKKSNLTSFAEPQNPSVQKETIIQREVVKIPCKYCKTLLDPVQDKTCPKCGAPVQF